MEINMNNIAKCVDILADLQADCMLLLDEANMHYLCGFSPSEGAVVVFSNGDAYHLVDSRYTQTAQAHSIDTGLEAFEIQGPIFDHIADLVTEHNANTLAYEGDTILLSRYEHLQTVLEDVCLVSLGNALMLCRNIKEPEEILYMKKANAIAEKAFLELLNHVKPGKTERELAAYFDYLMAQQGSEGISFDTILLTGANTSMPHGVPGNDVVRDGDFVLFDFGATYKGYHSDMTRTVAVGHATDEMKKMYNLVLDAQLAGIKALNAGVACADVYKAAYDVLDAENMAGYFRHGLGHGVGLEIHEGYNASPRSKDVYEVGNVTSVEPGIYIPNKFGIRIEDVCYLSPHGRENLSTITKQLIVL